MRAPVSVIIPTLNADQVLCHVLSSLGEGLEAGLIREVIFADGGSSDHTSALAEASGAILVTSEPGRGTQLRAGCDKAEGAWLLVLHADTSLCPGWSAAVLRALSDPQRAYFFDLAFRADGLAPRLVAGWANLRARRAGLPYGDQGLLMSRRLYEEVGGYADVPLMEDVAIARALRGRLSALGATAQTGAERYVRDGWLRRGARNLGTLLRYFLGVPPRDLVSRYEKK